MRAGELRRAYGGVLKHARTLRDRGDDHQPGQRADSVPVDTLERLSLVKRAGQHRNAGGDQRDDGAVNPVPDDHRVGHAQQDGREPHRVEAENDMRCEMVGHGVVSAQSFA